MSEEQPKDEALNRIQAFAREQMELGDEWTLNSMAAALTIGLEEVIDRLDADTDLDDGARWRELQECDTSLAWLPQGYLLVTMRRQAGGATSWKSAFVKTV